MLKRLLAAFGLGLAPAKLGAEPSYSTDPDRPIAFAYKVAWLAVRSADTEAVAQTLGLQQPQPANWASGFEAVFRQGTTLCFVTPPVDGWTLVVNDLLLMPDTDEGNATLTKALAALSQAFGECQYFGSYRIAGYAAWYRAEGGAITRGYAYADGGFFANIGEVTEAERALGFGEISGLSPEELTALAFAGMEDPAKALTRLPTEEDPALVAEAWSVNPDDFENRTDLKPGVGILGALA